MDEYNVKFVGVGRTSDLAIMAFHTCMKNDPNENQYITSFKEVMKASAQVQPETRQKLNFDLGTINFKLDKNYLMYLSITESNYPERHTFAMIDQMMKQVAPEASTLLQGKEGSYKNGKKILRDVASNFQDLKKIDKTAATIARVGEVQLIMQNNVKQILQTHENLETLEQKTDDLRVGASQFVRSAVQLKRVFWWRNLKMKLILAAVIIAVLLIVLVPIIIKFNNS
eukprot:GILJ01002434.1.p1 GENE.GILJ01002434.1~~GILJ01002434.1.p1  ORF type:complete len:227 (+),score=40.18 GILJ01002434.1:64-744(+)